MSNLSLTPLIAPFRGLVSVEGDRGQFLKRIFVPTGKVGAYASVNWALFLPRREVGAYVSFKKLASGDCHVILGKVELSRLG
jgi:hypothetical protein